MLLALWRGLEGRACDAMGNPFVHALVFAAAVLIPGGLLVYFAWRCARKSRSLKANPNHTAQKQGSEDIPEGLPPPGEALEAFLKAYPKYPTESLRARSKSHRLNKVRSFRRRRRKTEK